MASHGRIDRGVGVDSDGDGRGAYSALVRAAIIHDQRYSAQGEITEDALIALKLNGSVPATAVKIAVHEGWITLEGELPNWHQKVAAEEALASLRGVRGMSNNIQIRAPLTVRSVERQIKAALHRRAQLDATKIHVTAAEGTVTLEGEVDSWAEREQATSAAWHAPGVSNVIDRLTVRG